MAAAYSMKPMIYSVGRKRVMPKAKPMPPKRMPKAPSHGDMMGAPRIIAHGKRW